LLLVAAGSVLIGVSGDELIALLSGDKFVDGGVTLLLMYIGLASVSQRTVIEMAMQITGQTQTLRLTSYLAPIALVCVWFTADLGLNMAIAIVMVFATLANWFAMSRLRKFNRAFIFQWQRLAAIIIPAILGIIAGLAIKETTNPAVAGIAGLAIFGILVWIAKPLRQDELALIQRSIGEKAGKVFQQFTHA